MNLPSRLRQHRQRIDRRLKRLLPPATAAPRRLHRAMRYSVLGGGKRLRPILCLEAAALFGARPATTLTLDLACAVECIHAYSLIHDDLPALDNDDLRRGRLTCHKKFNEATAILAGDALLTLAFEIAAGLRGITPKRCNLIVQELAAAAGTNDGMIAGQIADLEAEGKKISAKQLESIHRGKTGALIRAAVRVGAIYSGASTAKLRRLSRFGAKLGLAFQIVDDILDVESSTRRLGKTAHKDAAHGKATYPVVHGLEESRRIAASLIEKAVRDLEPFGRRGEALIELTRSVLGRAS